MCRHACRVPRLVCARTCVYTYVLVLAFNALALERCVQRIVLPRLQMVYVLCVHTWQQVVLAVGSAAAVLAASSPGNKLVLATANVPLVKVMLAVV